MEDDVIEYEPSIKSTIIIPDTPQKMGFKLEDIIHNGVKALHPAFECRREKDIRDTLKDQSLNGVDHWIKIGTYHILIQDKWCETFTQTQASQFLNCAKKIQKRLSPSDYVLRMWVSKCSPTKNAQKDMKDENVQIIVCNVSIQALARHVIEHIASLFGLDTAHALKVIQ